MSRSKLFDFRMLWKFEKYKTIIFINGLIHFLGRIPLLGKIVPTQMLYRDLGLKKILSILRFIFRTFFIFIKGSIPLFLSMLLNHFFSNSFLKLPELSLFTAWLLIYLLLWQPIAMMFYLIDDKDLKFLSYFHQSPLNYLKSDVVFSQILRTIAIIPSLIFLGVTNDHFILTFISGLTAYLAFNWFWIWIDFKLSFLKFKTGLKSIVIIFTIAFIFMMLWLTPKASLVLETLQLPWMVIVYLVTSLFFAWNYLTNQRYEEYSHIILYSSDRFKNWSEKIEKSSKNTGLSQGKSYSKKMTLGKTSRLDKLTGTRYLNALFFERFKTVLRKGVLIRILGISIVGLAISVSFYFFKIQDLGIDEKKAYQILPFLFFMMYLLSFGKPVVEALFINCDSTMLNYPFYRDAKVIIRGFFNRFIRLFLYNASLVSTILFWVFIWNCLNGFLLSLYFFGVFILLLFSLAVLFSFHELFIYYILQPFTSEMQVKNPVYKFVDWFFYFIAYMNLQVHNANLYYALFVSVASLLYFAIGIIIIFRVSPKTFKIK
ncbi:hypothetical protein [Vagococcus sp.]|uniref:hypothetical protein n=1 Tax=Vagococcus sp. TaxID=1933889 RepID=UPI003F9B9056